MNRVGGNAGYGDSRSSMYGSDSHAGPALRRAGAALRRRIDAGEKELLRRPKTFRALHNSVIMAAMPSRRCR